MKPSDMRKLKAEDFSKEIESRKKELMELRFQSVTNALAHPHRVRELRREVAQLNTIRKELAGQAKGEQQ